MFLTLRYIKLYLKDLGCIAQLVEHQAFNLRVLGSSPNALTFMIIKLKRYIIMVNSINTDKKRRKLFLKNLKKRNTLKESIKNKELSNFERYSAQLALQKMPRNSSKIRIKNRCIITGRTHGLVGPFNISRIKLRELVSNGLVPGVKKAIW